VELELAELVLLQDLLALGARVSLTEVAEALVLTEAATEEIAVKVTVATEATVDVETTLLTISMVMAVVDGADGASGVVMERSSSPLES
jgi:hypothetical protein